MKIMVRLMILLVVLGLAGTAGAQTFDPTLHQKAQDYTDWLMQWHSTGLGGVSDVLFTDDNRTELLRTWGSGDSGDWTGTYLVSQAMRYQITGEQEAYDEVVRIAEYMLLLKHITNDPGYLARYAAPNEAPWNVESLGSDNFYEGTGEFEGYFWLGNNVRDKYITWFWAMAWAHDILTDETLKTQIRTDMLEIIHTLHNNNWTIIDPWGGVYKAAEISPDLRLSFLAQTLHATGDAEIEAIMDEEFEQNRIFIWLSSIAFFNLYSDYYAFINNYSNTQPMWRYWPDRPRFEYLWQVWNFNVRQWSDDGHNPFFDGVYYQGCLRLGTCDEDELAAIEADAYQSLIEFNEAPNYQRQMTCTTMEIDPFSQLLVNLQETFPWLEELFGLNFSLRTIDAHEIWDRCWSSVMWERTPYHVECSQIGDNLAHVAHGADYLIAYWMGVYYGFLPGGGPYGDDDLTNPVDDDTVDDDTTDDDTVDDDTVDDDTTDDDTVDDDAVDDDTTDDDDDSTDDDASPADDDDDDDDNDDGCGC
ncbi:MAG TPA: hypothetical protein PKW95_19105 [bacterium]|nr:hypothetical protein [bacterium]